MGSLPIIQVNLHHAKGASGVLSRRFTKENLGVALIQEPWVRENKVMGLPNNKTCKLLYDNNCPNPRAAILVSDKLNIFPLTEYISRDIVAIKVEVQTERGKKEIIISSVYFPGDTKTVPQAKVQDLIKFCRSQRNPFIIGCDANAHHTVWGSTDINDRGESLFEYLVKNNIDISNRGNEPTFVNKIRKEVLDLTLCCPLIAEEMRNWHVSQEESLSDHRHIRFDISVANQYTESYRDPRKTNWELYRKILTDGGKLVDGNLHNNEQLENACRCITQKITAAFHQSCPLIQKTTSRDVPWWNNHLSHLRKETRRLFNRAKRTSEWSEYKRALTAYNKAIRQSKRRSWRFLCERIDQTPDVAKLQKALAKDHTNGLGSLKRSNGTFTKDAEETLGEMMNTHFPGCIKTTYGDHTAHTTCLRRIRGAIYRNAKAIFTESKVKWAIESFEPFKAPGKDVSFPALLQQGKKILIPYLVDIFRASLTLGYIPEGWREVRVVFIPKSGKRDKNLPKSFRPISLTSIWLKIMEKILDDHIKSTAMQRFPLSKFQFAYQKGKSTISALHMLTTKIEKNLSSKGASLSSIYRH